MAPRPVPALPRLLVGQAPRSVGRSRQAHSLAQPRVPCTRSRRAVRPPPPADQRLPRLDRQLPCQPRADQRLHRSLLRLGRQLPCPPLPRADQRLHRSLLRLGRQLPCPPAPRADQRLPQSRLRLELTLACLPHRPLLQCGRQARPCSPRLQVRSRCQARRGTLRETSGSVHVRRLTRLKPTIWRSPRWGQLVGRGKRDCGCRGSIRGRS